MTFLFVTRAIYMLFVLVSSLAPMLHAQPTQKLTLLSDVSVYNTSNDTRFSDSALYALTVASSNNPQIKEPIATSLPLIPPPDVPIGEEPSLLEQAAIVKAQPPVILNIQFAYNKTQVEERFYAEIEKLSVYLKAHPLSTVVIEGHTDNLGDAMYNQHISEKRAQAIANVLMNIFGISDKRVTAIGYGEERPLYKNDTLTHRKANRRVTAVFY